MIEIKESFRTRLENALNIRDMKPVELAKKTGISEATISQYRSGYAKPKEKRLVLIANALGVGPDWLMGLDVPMEPREKHPGEMGGAAERESLYVRQADTLISLLNEDYLKMAIRYMSRLLDAQKAE